MRGTIPSVEPCMEEGIRAVTCLWRGLVTLAQPILYRISLCKPTIDVRLPLLVYETHED